MKPRISLERAKRLGLCKRNVFLHLEDMGIPERAYVAGAGPSLLRDLKRVPAGSYVIACNSALLAGVEHYRMFMAFDRNAGHYPWMHEETGSMLRVMGMSVKDPLADYVFHSVRCDRNRRVKAGGLQGGATIVFCALQLLYWAGCKHATVLAAPLDGNKHFDGSHAGRGKLIWTQSNCARRMAMQMMLNGMRITSYCPNSWGAEEL